MLDWIGLDWIKSNYPLLDPQSLMYEMQSLRQMHITMWVEAVRKVASAEDSYIKFIVSDHPVTVYRGSHPTRATTPGTAADGAVSVALGENLSAKNAVEFFQCFLQRNSHDIVKIPTPPIGTEAMSFALLILAPADLAVADDWLAEAACRGYYSMEEGGAHGGRKRRIRVETRRLT